MKHTGLPSSTLISQSLKALALSSVILLSQSSPVWAQAPQATTAAQNTSVSTPESSQLQMTAIPPRLGEDFSLKAKPGQTIQTTVRVKNSSNQTQTIKSLVEDFIIGEDGKEPVPVKEETPTQWSLAKWMTITPPINTLAPNQSATINVLIEVPTDALPGGRYAMIMHEPSDAQVLGGGAAAGISQRVGTLVYFLVEGDIHEEAYIRNVTAKPFFEFGPVPFTFTIENRSDIHIRPNVQVEIQNMIGSKVDTIALDPQNIFPGTERNYASSWTRKWGFGKYTATIIANYGDKGNVVREVFSFWMFPIRLILIVSFVVSVIIAILYFLKKKVRDTNKEKSKEIELLEQKVKNLESEKLHNFKDEQN